MTSSNSVISEFRKDVLKKAATRPKAEVVGDKCSLCGHSRVKLWDNFCTGCGATFITDAMIKGGKLCSDYE